MRLGEKRRLWIPSEEAYKSTGFAGMELEKHELDVLDVFVSLLRLHPGEFLPTATSSSRSRF
eukprot:751947-Hanusia_phi.AAC.2